MKFVIVYHHIILLTATKLCHYLFIFKAYPRYYYDITFYSFGPLWLRIIATYSNFMFALVHERWVSLWYIYYSEISVYLVIRDKFCWLLTKLVQRAINSIEVYWFILIPYIFQYWFSYLFTVKGKQHYFKMLTDVFQAFQGLIPQHYWVTLLVLISLINFLIYNNIPDYSIKMYYY